MLESDELSSEPSPPNPWPPLAGGGPGMMQAATLGAAAAGKPVGGIRIQREAGTSVLTASYLPPDSQVVCRYLSSR